MDGSFPPPSSLDSAPIDAHLPTRSTSAGALAVTQANRANIIKSSITYIVSGLLSTIDLNLSLDHSAKLTTTKLQPPPSPHARLLPPAP